MLVGNIAKSITDVNFNDITGEHERKHKPIMETPGWCKLIIKKNLNK